MIDKASLEQFLRINGIAPTSSEEEIKSVLLSARWDHEDVDTAMLVLRENTTTHESKVDSLHKVFRSDSRLRPDAVASLLGINMEVNETKGQQVTHTHNVRPKFTLIAVIGLTVAVSLGILIAIMWMYNIGPYHYTQF